MEFMDLVVVVGFLFLVSGVYVKHFVSIRYQSVDFIKTKRPKRFTKSINLFFVPTFLFLSSKRSFTSQNKSSYLNATEPSFPLPIPSLPPPPARVLVPSRKGYVTAWQERARG